MIPRKSSSKSAPKLLISLLFFLCIRLSTSMTCHREPLGPGIAPLTASDFASQCLTIVSHLPCDTPPNLDQILSNLSSVFHDAITSLQNLDSASPLAPSSSVPSRPFIPRASFLHDRCIVDIAMDYDIDESVSEEPIFLAWKTARARVQSIIEQCVEGRGLLGGQEYISHAGVSRSRGWYIGVKSAPDSSSWPGFYQERVMRGRRAVRGEMVSLEDLFETALYVI